MCAEERRDPFSLWQRNMLRMLVTFPTFQLERSPLNDEASDCGVGGGAARVCGGAARPALAVADEHQVHGSHLRNVPLGEITVELNGFAARSRGRSGRVCGGAARAPPSLWRMNMYSMVVTFATFQLEMSPLNFTVPACGVGGGAARV